MSWNWVGGKGWQWCWVVIQGWGVDGNRGMCWLVGWRRRWRRWLRRRVVGQGSCRDHWQGGRVGKRCWVRMWNYVVDVDLVEIVGCWIEDWCRNRWMVVVWHWCCRYWWMISFRYRKGRSRSRNRGVVSFRYREGLWWGRGLVGSRWRWCRLWMICINHWYRWVVCFGHWRWWLVRGRERWSIWDRYGGWVWVVMHVGFHWFTNSKADKGLDHMVGMLG